jgi:hypothetical protein
LVSFRVARAGPHARRDTFQRAASGSDAADLSGRGRHLDSEKTSCAWRNRGKYGMLRLKPGLGANRCEPFPVKNLTLGVGANP